VSSGGNRHAFRALLSCYASSTTLRMNGDGQETQTLQKSRNEYRAAR
jgi:hypothetical protein